VTWARFQDWVLENSRIVLGVVGVAAALALVSFLWLRTRADAEAKASGKMAEASALYWRGEYGPLIQRANDIKREYGGTKAATEAERMLGDAYFWQGDFKKSAEAYEGYLKKAPSGSQLRPGVERSMAQALESQKEYAKAAAIYERLASVDGPRDVRGELYYAAGRARQEAGDLVKAKAIYQKLTVELGDTPSAGDAEIALGELEAQGK
jgi:tetratricopeptide (TPR) repeat protein